MTRVFLIALVLFMNMAIWAQQAGINPGDPAFVTKYADLDFKGHLALAIEKDQFNNYFLVDFSKMPSRFERVYFMNLSFSYDELINIDPDITKARVCFMASNRYSETTVLKQFDKIKKDVADVAVSWTEEQKAEWLKMNDKYK